MNEENTINDQPTEEPKQSQDPIDIGERKAAQLHPENRDGNRVGKNGKKKGVTPQEIEPWLFKKGQSGNPGGRPKSKIFTKALRRDLTEQVPAPMMADFAKRFGVKLEDDATVADLWSLQVILQGVAGNLNAIAFGVERTDGRAMPAVPDANETNMEGGSLTAQIFARIVAELLPARIKEYNMAIPEVNAYLGPEASKALGLPEAPPPPPPRELAVPEAAQQHKEPEAQSS